MTLPDVPQTNTIIQKTPLCYYGSQSFQNTTTEFGHVQMPLHTNFQQNRTISKFRPIRGHYTVTMATDTFKTSTIKFAVPKYPHIPIFSKSVQYLNFDQSEVAIRLPCSSCVSSGLGYLLQRNVSDKAE